MEDERWERIKAIVDNILTLSGHERETYLNTVCQENPEISFEIKELLQAIEESEAEQFMKPIRQDHKELVAELSDELNEFISRKKFIDRSIGRYRITGQIGLGGMGTIFKAEREDGEFDHQVAIKLIKKGVDSEENIRRFKMEREILASLKHPNIAQLYDGGVTKDGIPYLIMEYIEGTPIDHYCNEHTLNIGQRLTLFKKVCEAVQYAHSKLVVHRDLKTQNIYVSSEGIIKILDFGIAKLLKPKLSEVTIMETRAGQKLWTPQYAAPEQVQGKEISTKTDIYALGVLLHKLLTDTYPFDLQDKSLVEIENIINNASPIPPSQSLSDNASKKVCATFRETTVKELTKELRGDLDALVLKAIRKDPEYRYTSVNQLLEDVLRYQSGIPLIARRGTWKYRASKFISRNKTGLAATAFFLLTTISFVFLYTWRISHERDLAEVQARKAEQVTKFMMGLFEANEPGYALGDTITARVLLERGIERAEKLSNQPEVQAEMLQVIGQVYQYLGVFHKAEILLEKSLEIRKQVFGRDHLEVADSQLQLAILRYTISDSNTDSLFINAISTYRQLLDHNDPRLASALTNQAIALRAKGKYAAAESLFREILKKYYNGDEELSSIVSIAMTYLGKLLIRKRNYEESESLLRDALSLRRKVSGDQHPVTANILDAQGELLLAEGNYRAAEKTFRNALAIRQVLFEKGHPDIAAGLINLGKVKHAKEEYAEAEKLFQKALSVYRTSFGEEDIGVANILRHLATIHLSQENIRTAEQFFHESLSILRIHSQSQSHPDIAILLLEIAKLHIKEGDAARAEPLLREALKIRQKTLPEGDWQIAEAQSMLGACLTALNRYQQAEQLLQKGYEHLKEKFGSQYSLVQQTLGHLITLYDNWGKQEKERKYRTLIIEKVKN